MRAPPNPAWMGAGLLLANGAVAGSTIACAYAAMRLPHGSLLASPIWLGAGIGVAALARGGRRLAPGVIVGAWGSALCARMPPVATAILASASILEAALAAALLSWRRFHPALERSRHVLSLSLLAAGFATLAGALSGVSALALAGFVPTESVTLAVREWWIGHAVGVLIAAPPLLAYSGPDALPWRQRPLEMLGVTLTTIAASMVAFFHPSPPIDGARSHILLLVHPAVMWAAIRLRPFASSLTVFTVALVALLCGALGTGPLSSAGTPQGLLLLQIRLAVFAFIGLVLSAVTAEREASDRARFAREQELREIASEFQAVTRAFRDIYVWLDREGRHLKVHAASPDDLVMPPEQIVGRRIEEVLSPEVAARIREALERCLRTHAPVSLEYRLEVHGVERWFETKLAPVEDGQVLASARDITEARQLRVQLEHAQRAEAVGRLAGGVAHDFSNVLQAIRGYASLLLERLTPGGIEIGYVQQIDHASRSATAITRNLLTLARRQVATHQPVEVNDLLLNLRGLLEPLLRPAVTLETVTADRPTWVVADPSQLEQVLLNLVVNSRDAMPGRGSVTIQVDDRIWNVEDLDAPGELPAGDYARILVRDAGCGMDPATLRRAFEPFFTTKPEGAGTGLGLSIVSNIVRESGGATRITSAVGQGTTFEVFLPRHAHLAPTTAEREDGPRPEQAPLHVLLVEDDRAVRDVLVRLLTRAGHVVRAADHGLDALERLGRGERVDVLVTDLAMPTMGGGELAARACERWPELRILFVSGSMELDPAKLPARGGRSAWLAKPFTNAQLLDAIERLARGDEKPAPVTR